MAAVAARFGAALRQAGLPVGPGRCERFAAAVTLARPATLRALYLCAQATLICDPSQAGILAAVFGQVFGGLADPAGLRGPAGATPAAAAPGPRNLLAVAAQAAQAHVVGVVPAGPAGGPAEPDRDGGSGPELEHRYLGSSAERLAARDFAELSDAELAALAGLMRRISLAVPSRRSRRRRRRPGGTGPRQ